MTAAVTPAMTIVPMTEALRLALSQVQDARLCEDLLYLERWEREPMAGSAAALRILQIRRANPELAARIRAELSAPRSLRTPIFRPAPPLDHGGRPGL